jgi:hypothetical protein
MLKSILIAGVFAAAAAPTLSMAEPYDNSPPQYPPGEYSQSGPYYSGDYSSGYRRDDGPYDSSGYYYDRGPPSYGNGYYARGGYAQGNRVFTGRVGASWRDYDGRRCQWREVTWRDRDDDPAYKWITVCED